MEDNEILDPHDDPDFISEEGTGTAWGDALPTRTWGIGTTVFVPKTSTPLQEDAPDSSIPTFALWSMKYLRRGHLFGRGETEIRQSIGEGDNVIYILDDGRNHCLVSRSGERIGGEHDPGYFGADHLLDHYRQAHLGVVEAISLPVNGGPRRP